MEPFHEVRHIRKGAFSMSIALVLALLGAGGMFLDIGVLGRAALLGLAGGGVVLLAVAGVETVVRDGQVTIRVIPFKTRRFDVADVVNGEVVIADNLVPFFGGWNAREDWLDATVGNVEGRDRSVGNRAVRFRLADGAVVQVGSWKPHKLLAAVGVPRRG